MKTKASLPKRIAQIFPGLLVAALILAAPAPSFGQTFSASVTGIVSDPGQAVIAGASVTIRNVETNDTRRASTSSLGRYTFSQLVPGTYELTAEVSGFHKLVVSTVQLVANQSAEFDLRLQIGDVATSIEVSAAVIGLDTQTANQSRTLNEQAVLDLPISTRSPFEFVNTMAGVTSVTRTLAAAPTRAQNYSRFAFNGGRDMTGLVLVDGAPATSGDWGGLLATPNVDSVQEFQLTRNSYDAQFGKSGGGILNLVSKGGSNDLHFSAFEFLRNGDLDANAWDRNRVGSPKLGYQRHQFGGDIAGPISKRSRLFFFGGWENLREEQPQTVTTTVPTLKERQGDFSESRNPNNSLQLLYDPFSGRAGTGGIVRDPFPDNKVPSNRFDPVGKNVAALYPAPNVTGLPITNANNFFGSGRSTANNNSFDVRVDWARTEKHTLFVRVSKAWQDRMAPRFYGNGVDTGNEGGNPRHHITIGSTFIPTPTFVVNVLLGSGRWREQQYSPCIKDGLCLSSLGFPTALVSQFDSPMVPGFGASGYASLGNNRYLDMPRETHNLQVNATRQFGSHTLKFGASGELQPLYDTDAYSASFSFDRGMTSGPTAQSTSTVSGNSIASLLLGTGSSGSAPIAVKPATMQKYYGTYVQDTWRVGRLTLNAGLRYETQRPRTERYNRLGWFDFNAQNPLGQAVGLPLTGGLVFATPSQRGQTDPDNVDLAPRVGLAFEVHQKIVFRAGYGIFYLQKFTSGPMSGTDGFSTSTAWVTSVGGGGLQPQDLLSNPFPKGIIQPAGSSQGLQTLVGSSITATQRLNPSGYLQNYSFDLQYSLARNTLLQVGYSGNTGRKLTYVQSTNVNQLDPMYLAKGAGLSTQVANPFYGKITSGILAGATVPQNQLLRRYPQYASVSMPADTPGAWSNFNALFIDFSRQIGNSLNLSTTYQWSKALDNASESGAFRNVFDKASDKSVSTHDVPHSFKSAVVWALPIGRGQRLGAGMPQVARAILGGWQVSAIGTLSSGLPLQLTAANTLSTYGFSVLRPNISDLRNLQIANQSPGLWFNTTAVTAPAAYTIGNAPRFLPNLRTGQSKNIDLALLKTFTVREHYRIQFRAESFNLTNTPRFDSPGTSLGSATFGVVSAVTNLPRNVQFGIKLLH